jgi:molecular chaperone DnaJ
MKTHYETIGIEKTATQDEIRKAYLSLAKQLHPDKTGGDKEAEDKLKEINAAYDILKDKKKREDYDLSLVQPSYVNISGFGPMMHGMMMQKRDKFAPHNIQTVAYIMLEDVYSGSEKEIFYDSPVKCTACDGIGGADFERCKACGGSGMIHSMNEFTQVSRTCPTCRGKGGKVKDPCTICSGSGIIQKKESITIKIPKGIDSGQGIIIEGKGAFGGNLFIVFKVMPHEKFERNGLDIASKLIIPLKTALLGGKELTSTLRGEVEVTIPEGSNTGEMLRLKGLGLPVESSAGDHFLVINVIMPKNLSEKAKELIEELDKEIGTVV